jgi:hypothetical protein
MEGEASMKIASSRRTFRSVALAARRAACSERIQESDLSRVRDLGSIVNCTATPFC